MIRWLFKAFVWLFVGSFVVVAIQGIFNPMPKPPPATPQQEAAAKQQSKDGEMIFQKAYIVGRTMARSGAIKPNAAQIDALSRRAQTQAGDNRSRLWFKQSFESGFWAGWNSR